MSNEIPTPSDVHQRLSQTNTGLLDRTIEQIKVTKGSTITVKIQNADDGEVGRVIEALRGRGWSTSRGKVQDAHVLLLSDGSPPTPSAAQNNPLPRPGDESLDSAKRVFFGDVLAQEEARARLAQHPAGAQGSPPPPPSVVSEITKARAPGDGR